MMTQDDAGSTTTLSLARHTLVSETGRHLYVYGELRGRQSTISAEPEPVGLHLRLDLLTASWVAVSPARNVRPHSSMQPSQSEAGVACPLCPGGPEVPFSYDAAVFDNRFPAFVEHPPDIRDTGCVGPSLGRCEVVLYTSQHDGSLATLTPLALARVVAVLRAGRRSSGPLPVTDL